MEFFLTNHYLLIFVAFAALLFHIILTFQRTRRLKRLNREIEKRNQDNIRYQALLLENEKKYEVIFKTNPDAVLLIDSEGNLSDFNEKMLSLFGFSADEVSGKNTIMEYCFDPEDRRKFFQIVYQESRIENLIARFRRNDGSLFSGLISASLMDLDGKAYTMAVIKDISELNKAAEEAQNASRLKSSLLLNMSHELRTPLNGIIGFSEILSSELKDEEHRYFANLSLISARRLHRTLNSIMDLAQLESSSLKANNKPVEIANAVGKVLTKNELFFNEFNSRITTSLESELIAFADNDLLEKVIFELVENALKFTQKGLVEITTGKESIQGIDMAVLKIRDNGIGITSEQMKYILDPFRQGSEGMGRSYEGSGIGLSLVQKSVNLMQGYLDLDSTPGFGTAVTVSLPLAFPDKETDSGAGYVTAPHMQAQRLKKKILVVEDNKPNNMLLEKYLDRMYHTDFAVNGKEAIRMASADKYDLILMDINLGIGYSGIDATREIRKQDHYVSIPIIAVTGYSTEDEKRRILEGGLNEVIVKPFEKEKLLSTIIRALESANC